MLLILFLRSHSQQILPLAQQKKYEKIIEIAKQAIKSQMYKINSEVSVYEPVNMKVPTLIRKEWEISEEL